MRFLIGKTIDPHLYDIYLDGELVQHCFEADDESGIIFCYMVDEEGHYVPETDPDGRVHRDEDGRLKPKEICLRGRVEIRKRLKIRDVWVNPSDRTPTERPGA